MTRLDLPALTGISLAFNFLLRRTGELLSEEDYTQLLDDLDSILDEYREPA